MTRRLSFALVLFRFVQNRNLRVARQRKAASARDAAFPALGTLLTFLLFAEFATAQAVLPLGITQWSTQIVAGPVSIDMATGAMVLQIPVRDKAGAIPFTYNLLDNAGNLGAVNYPYLGGDLTSGNIGGLNYPSPTLCGPYGNESNEYGGTKFPNAWSTGDATGAKHTFGTIGPIIVGPGVGCGGEWGPVTALARLIHEG